MNNQIWLGIALASFLAGFGIAYKYQQTRVDKMVAESQNKALQAKVMARENAINANEFVTKYVAESSNSIIIQHDVAYKVIEGVPQALDFDIPAVWINANKYMLESN